MTKEQTRQLGIEFERRVQTMIPETELVAKLDTETIYSYLNQYQDKYIKELYKAVDQIPVQNVQANIEKLIQELITSIDYTVEQDTSWELPSNFGMYISSYSTVSDSYRYKQKNKGSGILPNTRIAQKDASKALQRPHDDMRILRSPIIWLTENNRLEAVYDRYTKPTGVHMEYYRLPKHMDLMTSTPCELPMEAFEDLVSGAVDLYVQYVAGAEARKRQMAEQQQQQRNKKNEDE